MTVNCMSKRMIETRFLINYESKKGNGFCLDVDISLSAKGITAIFGHSGSGKTTYLRCLAGLEQTDKGYIKVGDAIWQEQKQTLPTHKRPLGYVFQEASLFSHLTVEGNLQYAIKRGQSEFDKGYYTKIIEVMGIEFLLEQDSNGLSGGEKQRVSIARALLSRPEILLLDEPLASLDYKRKQEILPYLEQLKKELAIPIIYVSHSMNEVARLANEVVILEQGRVVSQGSPIEVFSNINMPYMFEDEVGVVLEGRVQTIEKNWHLTKVKFSSSTLWVREGGELPEQNIRVRILARDISLTLNQHADTSILNRLEVEIEEMLNDDDESMKLLKLKAGSDYLIARITKKSCYELELGLGQKVWAQIKSVAIVR